MGRYDAIKELFDKSDACITIDIAKKQETQKMVKEFRNGVSRLQLIKMQFSYMDKTILLLHLAACLGTFLLGRHYQQQWGQISMIVSGVLGALSLLEVGNLFYSGMAEIGESCYLNVQQLVVFQLVYSGLLSLAALLLTTMSVSGSVYIYSFVPFVFTECVCMAVMLTEMGRRNLLILVAAGVFSALFWSVLASMPELYEASALIFWGISFFAGCSVLAIQFRRFFCALDKGEILCAD